MTEDWRAQNAGHLKGLKLHFSAWSRPNPSWDHDHCTGCGAKFADFDGPDIQRAGYATGEDYSKGARYDWVCTDCFRDLKDALEWSADEPQTG